MTQEGLTNPSLRVFYVSKEETNCPLIIEMIKIGKNLKERGILKDNNSATISMKYGKRILINSNVKDFSKIQKEEVIEIVDYNPLNNHLLVIGPGEPKVETTLHWMIHHARDEVNIVIQINDKKLLDRKKDEEMISTEKTPMPSIEFIKSCLKQLRDSQEIFIKEKGVVFAGKSVKDVNDLIEKIEDLK